MRLCKSCFLNSRRNGDMWTDYVVTEVGEQVGKKIVRVNGKDIWEARYEDRWEEGLKNR